MSTSAQARALALPQADLLAACEARLHDAVDGSVAEVVRPATETLAAGGKRVRPLLVFCSAPQPASRDEPLLAAAAAVELVHMATLVHDDLIDGATMRRGRPTVAEADGPETAVRAGDFLFARAFAELTRTGSMAAVQALAGAALDLSMGEMDQDDAAFNLDLAERDYLDRCRRKTAALFSAACRLGALVGGGGDEPVERLAAFGENVGMAFQIFDDILDLAGSPAVTGKPRGTDLTDGTVTLPVILALRHEPELRQTLSEVSPGPELEALCDRLAAHPGLFQARERALAFAAAARGALEGDLGGADARSLRAIADGLVDRYS